MSNPVVHLKFKHGPPADLDPWDWVSRHRVSDERQGGPEMHRQHQQAMHEAIKQLEHNAMGQSGANGTHANAEARYASLDELIAGCFKRGESLHGKPREWARTLKLPDGTAMSVRAIRERVRSQKKKYILRKAYPSYISTVEIRM